MERGDVGITYCVIAWGFWTERALITYRSDTTSSLKEPNLPMAYH